MKPETLEALKGSIAAWEKKAKTRITYVTVGSHTCPLCSLFNSDESAEEKLCKGCPVFEKTGKILCETTPYRDAADAKWQADQVAFRAAAKREIEFLKSLLPKGEGK